MSIKFLQESLVFVLMRKNKLYLTQNQNEILDETLTYSQVQTEEWNDEWLYWVEKFLSKELKN